MTYHTELDVRARRHRGALLLLRGGAAMRMSDPAMRVWHGLARRAAFDRGVVRRLCAAEALDPGDGDRLIEALVEKGFVARDRPPGPDRGR